MSESKRDGLRLIPTLSLDAVDAADALGVSLRFFRDNIQGDLPCVYIRSKRLFPVSGLKAWLDREMV